MTINLKKYNTTAGIHTLQIRVPKELITISDDWFNDELKTKFNNSITICETAGKKYKSIRLNPNKLSRAGNDNRLLTSYSEFQENLQKQLSVLGLSERDVTVNRVDFAFDSTDPTHYEYYRVLYGYLTLAMAINNQCHRDNDLTIQKITLKQKSDRCKNSAMQIEYYDKEEEAGADSIVKSRCEFRWTRMDNSDKERSLVANIPQRVTDYWYKQFDKCRKLDSIGNPIDERCNHKLLQQYNTRTVKNLSGFLREHKHNIFTYSQLYDFLFTINGDLTEKQVKRQISNLINADRANLSIIHRETAIELYGYMIAQMLGYFNK